jgi:hypothetical protein
VYTVFLFRIRICCIFDSQHFVIQIARSVRILTQYPRRDSPRRDFPDPSTRNLSHPHTIKVRPEPLCNIFGKWRHLLRKCDFHPGLYHKLVSHYLLTEVTCNVVERGKSSLAAYFSLSLFFYAEDGGDSPPNNTIVLLISLYCHVYE